MHCCSQAAAPNSSPFYHNPLFLLVSLHSNSRLISLDSLELSKFLTLTDINTIVAPSSCGALQSILDRFARVIFATILRSDIGFSRFIPVKSCKIHFSFTLQMKKITIYLLLTNKNMRYSIILDLAILRKIEDPSVS